MRRRWRFEGGQLGEEGGLPRKEARHQGGRFALEGGATLKNVQRVERLRWRRNNEREGGRDGVNKQRVWHIGPIDWWLVWTMRYKR